MNGCTLFFSNFVGTFCAPKQARAFSGGTGSSHRGGGGVMGGRGMDVSRA
jgi:hypothetical protein